MTVSWSHTHWEVELKLHDLPKICNFHNFRGPCIGIKATLHQHSGFNADMFMYIVENHTYVIGKSQTTFIVDNDATAFHNTPS